MKRWICILFCLTVSVAARADELENGVKAWEQRDFATAQTIFTKLASGGNPEAQLRLGEMYGYGEGVPEDLAQAEQLLGLARAGGHKEAAESLANVRQRAARKDEIARYLAGAGAVPTVAEFGCVRPAFPEVSRTQKEIRAVSARTADWRNCYERYAATLAAAPPSDLLKLMNLVELERGRVSRSQAMERAANAANAEVAAFGNAAENWHAATKRYAENMLKITREESDLRLREVQDLIELARGARREGLAHGFMSGPAH